MSQVTRRNFLKCSTAVGAGVLFCGNAAAARAYSANERLRIAVAGNNGRGSNHIDG